jgi:hypothetical protein
MKAHHNYTTAMKTAIRLRWGTATLLLLAALLVGLLLLLSTNWQSTLPTSTSASFIRHVDEPIASCRACRDEWVAAHLVQSVSAVSAQQLPATGSLTSCRACRDEWIAAQSPIIPTGGVTFEQPEELFRTAGPR